MFGARRWRQSSQATISHSRAPQLSSAAVRRASSRSSSVGTTSPPIHRGGACLPRSASPPASAAPSPLSLSSAQKKNKPRKVANLYPSRSSARFSSTFTSYKTGEWTRRQQQRDICNPFLGIPLAPPPTVFSADEWRGSLAGSRTNQSVSRRDPMGYTAGRVLETALYSTPAPSFIYRYSLDLG